MSAVPWSAARSLAERAGDPRPAAGDEDRAARWATGLGAPDVLGRRAAAAGLAPDELAAVLASPGPAAGAEAPGWWADVETTLAPGTRSPIADRDDAEDADVVRGALRVVAPFARGAYRRLKAHPTGGDDAARSLTDALAAELVELCRPAVAFELVASAAAEGWSPGDPAVAASFLRGLGEGPRARAFFRDHPSLARMVATRTRLGIAAGLELLDRVEADRPRVRRELLDGADPGALVAVSASGDSHDGGRRVAVLTFASGARAVLKPRPMAADAAYQRLLGALNDRGFAPAFAVVPTIESGAEHGWQAFVDAGDCTTEEQVTAYFRRLGGQLAVLHALQATDIHQENVLACGEHPVVVDLETVLHPRLGGERAATVDPVIAETGADSLLRVGLLPRRDVAFGVDISGLGRDPDGVVEVAERAWAGARVEERRVALTPGANAARLRGAPVRPHEHVDALAAGFADAYDLLVAHREELLRPGGALAAFAGIPVRIVLRPTKVYADLLRGQSEDLECVDDGLAREERLNVLWRGAVRRPELAWTAPAEHDDLWAGDVPKIGGTVGTADGHHHERGTLPGMLGPHPTPGPAVVRRLDGRDRERQLAFLRASVLAGAAEALPPAPAGGVRPAACGPSAADAASSSATASSPSSPAASLSPAAPSSPPAPSSPAAGRAPDSAEARAAAVRVGHRLDVLALREEDRAGWLTVSGADGTGTLQPLDASVRRGQAGVVLFLTRLHAATGDPATAALAVAAGRQLLRLVDRADAPEGATDRPDERPLVRAILAGVPWETAGSRPPDIADPAAAEDAGARPGAPDAPDGSDGFISTAGRLASVVAGGGLAVAPPGTVPDPAAAPVFARGVETPELDGGLAGVGLGWLALAGDAEASAALGAAALPGAACVSRP